MQFKTFFMLLLVTVPLFCGLWAQEDCLIENINVGVYKAFLESIDGTNTQNLVNTEDPYLIPVNIVVLHESSATWLNSATITEALFAIDYLNERVDPNMQFFLCDFNVYEDEVYGTAPIANPPTPGVPSSDFRVVEYDNYANPSAVNVFVNNTPLSVHAASLPWDPSDSQGLYLRRTGLSDFRIFSHEMGHYFGLLHTREGSVNGLILPDNTYHPNAPLASCRCCDCINPDSPENGSCLPIFNPDCEEVLTECDCNGDNSGDFVSDTNVDPGSANCGFSCDSECEFSPIYGGTYIYTPPTDNLMGNYTICRDQFTDGQRERMYNTLLNHPNRAILLDPDISSCADLLTSEGFVMRSLEGETGELTLDPFVEAKVEFYLSGQGTLDCEPTTNNLGSFSTESCSISPMTGSVTYGPKRDDITNGSYCVRNGVSTFDLIAITKHILTVDPFYSPYQYLAADVNNSGSVTNFDNIQIRKMILGVIDEFPGVDSWRFLPVAALDDPIFADMFTDDPFTASWDAIDGTRNYLPNGSQKSYLDFAETNTTLSAVLEPNIWSFYAIKSGDVNGSALVDNPGALSCLDGLAEGEETIIFTETKQSAALLSEGITTEELLIASVSVGELEDMNIEGYQFSLNFDDYDLELVAVEPGDLAFSSDDFVVDYTGHGATIKTLWANYETSPKRVTENEKFFQLIFRPKHDLMSMTGLISFGGDNSIADLVILEEETKAGSVALQVDYQKANLLDFVIKEAYGNPFSATGNLHINLDLMEQKDVTILLQDDFGHMVMLDYNNLVIGENNIEIPASTVSFLQNGKIYYTISTDEQVQSGSLIKLQ